MRRAWDGSDLETTLRDFESWVKHVYRSPCFARRPWRLASHRHDMAAAAASRDVRSHHSDLGPVSRAMVGRSAPRRIDWKLGRRTRGRQLPETGCLQTR